MKLFRIPAISVAITLLSLTSSGQMSESAQTPIAQRAAAQIQAIPSCDVSGTYSVNTTLDSSCIWVFNGVSVPTGVTLTLTEGAIVKVTPLTSITVSGKLEALGTPSSPVYITSLRDDSVGGDTNGDSDATNAVRGDWLSIRLSGSAELTLTSTVVRYGGSTLTGNVAGQIDDGGTGIRKVALQAATIEQSGASGIAISDFTDVTSANSVIRNNNGRGLSVGSGTLDLRETEVASNGNDAVYLNSSTPPVLINNNFHDNNGSAFVLESARGVLDPAGNVASRNLRNGMKIFPALLAGDDLTLNSSNSATFPFIWAGGSDIPSGAALNIQAGAILKLEDNISVDVTGTFTANGTGVQPAIITSVHDDSVGGDTNNDSDTSLPGRGDWGTISVTDGGTFNLVNSELRYGGNPLLTRCGSGIQGQIFNCRGVAFITIDGSKVEQSGTAGVNLGVFGVLTITNSTLRNNNTYGARLVSGALSVSGSQIASNGNNGIFSSSLLPPTLVNNVFQGNAQAAVSITGIRGTFNPSGNTALNNRVNGIEIAPSLSVGDALTLQANNAATFPYVWTGGSVGNGATLTLEAGAIMKPADGTLIDIQGRLNANGASANRVQITSIHDDTVGGDTNNDSTTSVPGRGNWRGIRVNFGGVVSLTSTRLRYAGNNLQNAPGAIYNDNGNGIVTVQDTTIEQSGSAGISIGSFGSLTVLGSLIRNNNQYGIRMSSGPLNVSGSEISANGLEGILSLSTTTPLINNNVFNNNVTQAAVRLTALRGDFNPIGNSGTNNKFNGFRITPSLGNGINLILRSNNSANMPYVMSGATIPAGSTLTLTAGTVVKIEDSGSVFVSGSLVGSGTSAKPVAITSLHDDTTGGDTNSDGSTSTPGRGDWAALYVRNGGILNLTQTRIAYGGRPTAAGAIYNDTGTATISLTNSTVEQSAATGVYLGVFGTINVTGGIIKNHNGNGVFLNTGGLSLSGVEISGSGGYGAQTNLVFSPILNNNNFHDNTNSAVRLGGVQGIVDPVGNVGVRNALNGIEVLPNYTAAAILQLKARNAANFPYIFPGAGVPAGKTLQLDAGSVVKMTSNQSISVSGIFKTQGTGGAPVTITSVKDDTIGGDTNRDAAASSPNAGDWSTVQVNTNGTADIRGAVVRFGGGNGAPGEVYNASGTLAVTDSTVETSSSFGVYSNSSTSIAGSRIRLNANGFRGIGGNSISSSTIAGNANYGVQSGSGVVSARYNFWGDITGPRTDGSGCNTAVGSGDKISCNVDWKPHTDAAGNAVTIIPFQATFGGPTYNIFVPHSPDPVNLATGNYIQQQTDVSVAGIGLPLEFARSYNSRDSYSGPLGVGWTHNYNVRLSSTNLATADVIVIGETGRQDTYVRNADGSYSPPVGIFDKLTRNSGTGTFDLLRKDRSLLRFDNTGKLSFLRDANGNQTTLTYDGSSRLSEVTDPSGRKLTLGYDGSNRITSVTDPITRVWLLSYNGAGDLVSVTNPLSGVTAYGYDAGHRMTTVIDPEGHTIATNVYTTATIGAGPAAVGPAETGVACANTLDDDSDGTVNDGCPGENAARVTSQTNADGKTTTFLYEVGKTTETDPRGTKIEHQYDGLQRETRKIEDVDGLALTWDFTYDEFGRTSIKDPLGRVNTFAYDSRGNLLEAKEPAPFNGSTQYQYDANDNVVQKIDAVGHVWTYTYDIKGNLTSSTDPAGALSTNTYNALGQRTTAIDPLGNVMTFGYNPNGYQTTITNALGKTTTSTYDNAGRKLTETDPLTHATAFAYDALNRLTSVTNALGKSLTYTYDDNGNKLTETDANSRTTTFEYDNLNRLVEVTDARGGTASYAYDENSNRTGVTDPNNHTTTFEYDRLNRLTKVTDALSFVTTYAYDGAGNRVSRVDADGKTTSYSYDALNRLTARTSSGQPAVQFTYDALGNRLTMKDGTGTTTYSHDLLSRVKSVTAPSTGTVSYNYDLAGRRTSLTYPDGKVVTYGYDLNSQMTNVGTVGNWNGGTTTYTYDDAGRLIGNALPNGVTTSRSFNNANQLLNITSTKSAATLSSVSYGLDNVGNRLSRTDGSGVTNYAYDELYRLTSAAYPDATSEAFTYDAGGNRLTLNDGVGTTNYTYDVIDRMTVAGSTNYTYDKKGNRLTAGNRSFNYDTESRLLQVADWTGAPGTFCADVSGDGVVNLSDAVAISIANGKSAGQAGYTYEKDVNRSGAIDLNDIIQVALRIGQSCTVKGTYAYNGDGLRVYAAEGSSIVRPVWDTTTAMPVIVQEVAGRSYVYGPEPISQTEATGSSVYPLLDGIGSAVALTDNLGAVASTTTYAAFGGIKNSTGSSTTPFGFSGQQADGTGLIYLRARYYDPAVGRFLTEDRFPGVAEIPASQNAFAYANNNPISLTDRTGESFLKSACDFLTVVGLCSLWDMGEKARAQDEEINKRRSYYEYEAPLDENTFEQIQSARYDYVQSTRRNLKDVHNYTGKAIASSLSPGLSGVPSIAIGRTGYVIPGWVVEYGYEYLEGRVYDYLFDVSGAGPSVGQKLGLRAHQYRVEYVGGGNYVLMK